MDVEALRYGFTYLLFERVNLKRNEARFYYLAWQPTLLDAGAVVRIFGRKGGRRRVMSPVPYPSFGDAWPFVRSIIRRRLRNGYLLMQPVSLCAMDT